MKEVRSKPRWRWLSAALLILALAALSSLMASASGAAGSASRSVKSGPIAPSSILTVAPATKVTFAQQASRHIKTPARPAGVAINRPTVPLAQLKAMKAAAAAKAGSVSKPSPAVPNSSNVVVGQANLSSECAAGDGCWFPSDIHGSVGLTQEVTVTNSHINVYSKSPAAPVLLFETTLNSWFGYGAQALFDPQVQYDARWHRWVVTAEGFEEGAGGPQYLFVFISNTDSALSGGTIYQFDPPAGFQDYQHFSLTQDGIIFTYSNFNPGFVDARMFAVAKAIMYNAAGFSVPVFTGFTGTLTSPNVIDQNPRAYALEFTPGVGVRAVMYRNAQTGVYGNVDLITPIAGEQVTPPPDAPQPAVPACSPAPESNCNLDTLDGRFVDEPTQSGDSLWAVHTVALGSFAAPYWYQFDIEGAGAFTIKQGGFKFVSGSSHDFNASIVATPLGRAYLQWAYTDPALACATGCPSMAFAGRLNADPLNVMTPVTILHNSGIKLMGNLQSGRQRWGDYSSIRFDPSSATDAYLFQQRVVSTSLWGTRAATVRVIP
jgi:hypothetical protein